MARSPARLLWSGVPATPALRGQLAQTGIEIGGADPGHPDLELEVVATGRRARSPRPAHPGLRWIWLPAERPSPAAIAAAVGRGAYDVVPANLSPAAVAARLTARLDELRVPDVPIGDVPHLVTESPAGRRLLHELAQAARTSMPVLLTGETGTGKEVTARLLHDWSSRRARRFVPINCAAIPHDLLESELFGYAKGAFSGASQSYEGQLAAAEGGSVFLDEVDDTPTSFQVKLLRVLEDRVVSRLGENRWQKVDFRILAATNRDLGPLIARGLFGADLYERLAIVSIRLPPLRERLEDLPALVRHMLARFYGEEPAARDRHQVEVITPEALALLEAHAWPGNIRELRNVIYGALIRKRAGTALLPSDLPPLRSHGGRPSGSVAEIDADGVDVGSIRHAVTARGFNLRRAIEGLERAALTAALGASGDNASAAASLLGEVGRGRARDPGATVRAMMRRLGVAEARGPASPRRSGRRR